MSEINPPPYNKRLIKFMLIKEKLKLAVYVKLITLYSYLAFFFERMEIRMKGRYLHSLSRKNLYGEYLKRAYLYERRKDLRRDT